MLSRKAFFFFLEKSSITPEKSPRPASKKTLPSIPRDLSTPLRVSTPRKRPSTVPPSARTPHKTAHNRTILRVTKSTRQQFRPPRKRPATATSIHLLHPLMPTFPARRFSFVWRNFPSSDQHTARTSYAERHVTSSAARTSANAVYYAAGSASSPAALPPFPKIPKRTAPLTKHICPRMPAVMTHEVSRPFAGFGHSA